MKRYYFDLRDGEIFIEDAEGLDLLDIAEAQIEGGIEAGSCEVGRSDLMARGDKQRGSCKAQGRQSGHRFRSSCR